MCWKKWGVYIKLELCSVFNLVGRVDLFFFFLYQSMDEDESEIFLNYCSRAMRSKIQ